MPGMACWAATLLAAAAFAQETDYVPAASDLPRLIREVRHGDWKTRIHAIHTLGRMGSVEGLSDGVTDGVCVTVAVTLGVWLCDCV